MFGVSEFEFKAWLRHLTVTHKECQATKIFETKAGKPGHMSDVFDWMIRHQCEKGNKECSSSGRSSQDSTQPLF